MSVKRSEAHSEEFFCRPLSGRNCNSVQPRFRFSLCSAYEHGHATTHTFVALSYTCRLLALIHLRTGYLWHTWKNNFGCVSWTTKCSAVLRHLYSLQDFVEFLQCKRSLKLHLTALLLAFGRLDQTDTNKCAKQNAELTALGQTATCNLHHKRERQETGKGCCKCPLSHRPKMKKKKLFLIYSIDRSFT